mmetsp:Transcript_60406/g.174295  ORF Transcript_60406/g.174295 Transcript_60406/m.174295 type:complete len:414 (+) Transcript_60406:578-1819(+)
MHVVGHELERGAIAKVHGLLNVRAPHLLDRPQPHCWHAGREEEIGPLVGAQPLFDRGVSTFGSKRSAEDPGQCSGEVRVEAAVIVRTVREARLSGCLRQGGVSLGQFGEGIAAERCHARNEEQPLAVRGLVTTEQCMLSTALPPCGCGCQRSLLLQTPEVPAAEGELQHLAEGCQGGPRHDRTASSGATALAVQQRRYGGQRPTSAGHDVDGANVGMLFDAAQAPAEAIHDPHGRLHVVVVAKVLCPLALALVRAAPSVETHEDRARIELAQPGGAETEAGEALRRTIHHDEVAPRDERLERNAPSVILDINERGPLPFVGGQPIDHGSVRRVHGRRRIELRDIGAESREHSADCGPGYDIGEIQDPHPLKQRAAAIVRVTSEGRARRGRRCGRRRPARSKRRLRFAIRQSPS